MCGQDEFSGHLFGMLDRDLRTTVTVIRSDKYVINNRYQFVPCDNNIDHKNSPNTRCNYYNSLNSNSKCRNNTRRLYGWRSVNFNNCFTSKFNDTLLVFVCIWILIIQTTIAKPMASSLQVDQVIIRGRSQRISDQADTAISQLKVFFANYWKVHPMAKIAAKLHEGKEELGETWGMEYLQIQAAFGHRFDNLFPSGGKNTQKKYSEKLPEEEADEFKRMAVEFDREKITEFVELSDKILQSLIASFQVCYKHYDQRNEIAQEFLNSIQYIKTVRNEIWSCMDNMGLPHPVIDTPHRDLTPSKDDWVAETGLFVHVINYLELIQEAFQIIKENV